MPISSALLALLGTSQLALAEPPEVLESQSATADLAVVEVVAGIESCTNDGCQSNNGCGNNGVCC